MILAIAALTLLAQTPVFTEDFESGKLDPAKWEQRINGPATLAVEPADGAQGKFALHARYPATVTGAYAFIVATHLPDSVRTHYFGRARMKVGSGLATEHNPFLFSGEPGWPLSKFHEIGTWRGGWMPSFQENKSLRGQGRGETTFPSGVAVPIDKWFTIEWEFSDDPSFVSIAIDGHKLDTVKFFWPPKSETASNIIGGYREFGFGTRAWGAPVKDMDIWYDDIVISAK